MTIQSVVLNVRDIARSLDFYQRHLGAIVIESNEERAELDLVTARLVLVRVESPAETTWIGDDLQRGFRHVGFKVSDLDARVSVLHESQVPFHLEPIHAEGDVRITFFYDPDGTLVELVEGALQYHEVYDREAVDQDWALGDPGQPRFDHVAETVADLEATKAHYAELGYVLMAGIHQPSDDRGYEINYFHAGESSLEVFTYDRADKVARAPQLDGPGFVAVAFEGDTAPGTAVGSADGHDVYADADGLLYTIASA